MTTATLRSTKFLAGMVIGLVFGLLSVFWPTDMPFIGRAEAQVPDSGAQRNRMVKELVNLNAKMDELIALLKSGKIKVTCLQADNDNKKTEVVRHETPEPLRPVKIPTVGTNRPGDDSD